MKEQIRIFIQSAIEKLYPSEKDAVFSIDYAPAKVAADFASNVALALGKKLGKKPMDLAHLIANEVKQSRGDEIAAAAKGGLAMTVSIAPPGFLNFKLPAAAWQKELRKMIEAGERYGKSGINKGKKARVEYVSANPTGPIHIGNARGGPYGETICRVLEATGYEVLREYIHNDIGTQVEKLGQTLWYWYEKRQSRDVPFPEGGYQGGYLEEVAKAAPENLDVNQLTFFALEYIFKENLETMKRMGIEFDLIVKESELAASGKTAAAIEEVKSRGLAKEKEGALWFVYPGGEEDREAVIVRGSGQPTYFASDIAYHKEKFSSGYELVMDIFGSNHHGHVPKLRALTKIFGFDPEKFVVLLYQYVRVKRGAKVVKMSKRAGTYITAKEVLDEVGADSMIFFLLSTAVNTHMDFDLELAKDTSEKNPVYRVQYAHARIASIIRRSEESSVIAIRQPAEKQSRGDRIAASSRQAGTPRNDTEIALIRELSKFPELVAELSQTYEVHRLPHYLLGLADKLHSFYEKVKVITDDKEQTAARLALVEATANVLKNGLGILGIAAPEEM